MSSGNQSGHFFEQTLVDINIQFAMYYWSTSLGNAHILSDQLQWDQMAKFQVAFKGPLYDITVAGDSAEELVREFRNLNLELEKLLGSRRSAASPKKRSKVPAVEGSGTFPARTIYRTLGDLSIPVEIKDHLVDRRRRLTNWHTLFILLHYASEGLTNKEIRMLSEELGTPISYSWLDTGFHRKKDEGFVISRRPPGSKETLYFLAEPGKKEALKLIQDLGKNTRGKE